MRLRRLELTKATLSPGNTEKGVEKGAELEGKNAQEVEKAFQQLLS